MPVPTDSASAERFFATCPRNTEGLLLDELRALGAVDARETRAGVSFTGSLSLAYRVCLWSRIASRVLLYLTSRPISDLDELYEGVHSLPWEDHLAAEGTLAVEATSTIRQGPLAAVNTHFVEQRVKDAVVDRFRARTGRRPAVERTRPDVRIAVHLSPSEAVVSIDLSGEGLHRRGYRLEGGDAPLKENLAAAILMRAGWPAIAAQGGSLVDPMCGSGTLLIEGALLAADVAPGLLRPYYGFGGWKGFDPGVWQELMSEAEERRRDGLVRLPPIIGTDVDARALGSARANARRAGLAGRIRFEVCDLASLAPPGRPAGASAASPPWTATSGVARPAAGTSAAATGAIPGLVVTNPPYGKRLGEVTELVGLYETLGAKLKESFVGWQAAVFTANPELSAHLGLRAHRVNVLYNGPLAAKLLVFTIGSSFAQADRRPAEAGAPGLRADEGAEEGRQAADRPRDGQPTSGPGALMFANRLQKNLRHLRRWAARENVHCFRVYDADLPEYAVAVDVYDGWAHIQEYAPPASVDPVQARRRLKEVMAVVPEVLGIPGSHAVLKVRRPQRGTDQYQKLGDIRSFLEVEEGGLRFYVNLTDYLDTGLFLDQRGTRRLIRELAPDRRFLNLFAYTGSATVCAAAGGAASTTSVDLSRAYLEWAANNLELNGLSGPGHSFIRTDCLEWLAEAARGVEGHRGPPKPRGGPDGPVYDLIFLDAPTFSNSKSMAGTLDIQRDHPWLIRSAAALLSNEGILLFSTNFRRFKLDPAVSDDFLVRDLTRQTIPPDFARNPRIHTCFRIEPARPSGPVPRGQRRHAD